MATRSDIETLQSRVRDAMRTLEELKKTPQPVTGDSWVFYRHDARPGWDYEILDITDPNWTKTYKITYEVPDPSRGFMNMFYQNEFQYEYQGISADFDPVAGDPYSYWFKVKHATYTSLPAGLRYRFFIFAPQKGNLVITEQ